MEENMKRTDEINKKENETAVDETAADQTAVNEAEGLQSNLCLECGNILEEGQDFCPKCGMRRGESLKKQSDNTDTAVAKKAPIKRKKWIPVIIGCAAVVVVIILVISLRGTPVDEVAFALDDATMEVGGIRTMKYDILPEDATDQTVVWSSSDESIATVDENGYITGLQEGTCSITVTAQNGKSDTLTLNIVFPKPDLKAIYNEYCDSTWAYVSADGSYLKIDTNPNDIADYTKNDALEGIYNVNVALELPNSVIEKMSTTRAVDGRQESTYDDVTVSWSFHPDNGLEILYVILTNQYNHHIIKPS